MGRLINRSTNRVLAEHAECARCGRLFLGLMAHKTVPVGYALGLPNCDWVHTWGMRVPLDVVFCDRSGIVLRILNRVPPFRMPRRERGAVVAWETRAGGFAPPLVALGDTVVFE